MNLLLDTHILLWWLDNYSTLKVRELEAIKDPNNIVVVSAAVVWEMRIKQVMGKLQIPADFLKTINQQGFEILVITAEHAFEVGNLPMHHRDPFDRMIIAQAIKERLTIVTRDNQFGKYDVDLL